MLTIATGAALFAAEACTGGDNRPPVATEYAPRANAAPGGGTTGGSAAASAGATSGNTTGTVDTAGINNDAGATSGNATLGGTSTSGSSEVNPGNGLLPNPGANVIPSPGAGTSDAGF